MGLNRNIRNIDQQLEEIKELQKIEKIEKYKENQHKKEIVKIEARIKEYLTAVFSEYLETVGSQGDYFFYNKNTKNKLFDNCKDQFEKKYNEDVVGLYEKYYYKILKEETKKQEMHEKAVFLEEGEKMFLQEEENKEVEKKSNWKLNNWQLGLTIATSIVFFPLGLILMLVFAVCKNCK